MNFDALMEVTSFIASLLTAIASILIPIILYRSQKQKATLDYIKSGRDSWIQIDLALIGRPELLRHADSILSPGSEHLTDEQREKIWLALMILNVAFSDFIGLKYGYHEREEKKTLHGFIRHLMKDETTFNLSQNAYNEAFRAACRAARESVLAEQALELRNALASATAPMPGATQPA